MTDQVSGIDRQIIAALEPINLTLSMLSSHDQRVGAKVFYSDADFIQAVRRYYVATVEVSADGLTLTDRRSLSRGVSGFLGYVQAIFPNFRKGILTDLRYAYGRSFSELYKNSLSLKKLLEAGPAFEEPEIVSLVLPDQQSSPIYAKVEDNRVVLESGQPLHPLLRKEAVNETRQYLQKELSELDKALKASNIDRKYVEAFSRLRELIQFKDDAGAIAFGLHVKMISHLTARIEEEMSEVLNIQISSTLTHAAYFAAQYKDWMDFVQNAQNYPSRDIIESEIERALADVTSTLESNSVTVDERIPETIRLLLRVLSGTSEDRIQAVYAGVRAVENFCIAAIRYSYEQAKRLVQDAASKSRPAIVNIGAAAIILITLDVISNFMPVIKNASELSWILENLPKIERIGKILNK
jgi:hypothetical protein